MRTFLTAQYGQNGGKGDPYLLEALGALMGGGHPDAFQPILDMLTEVIKGTERPGRGWPIGESAAAGATPTTQETADPAPLDLPTVLANRRAAYVVLDRVSASFKVTPTPDLIARHPRPSFSKRLTRTAHFIVLAYRQPAEARSHIAFVTALLLLLVEMTSSLEGDLDAPQPTTPAAMQATPSSPAAVAALSSTALPRPTVVRPVCLALRMLGL